MNSEPASNEGAAAVAKHPSWDQRHKMIEIVAYFKAEQRGFAPGHELDDWLKAEQEVEESIRPIPSY